MIKISIIIPIYNVEVYVERCLRSVMAQKCEARMECILVDDCGTDKSMEIVEQMLSEYNGEIEFKILRHDHNKGLSGARNTGIRAAKGEYLYFIDSDDHLEIGALQCFTNFMKAHPDLDMIVGNPYLSKDNIELFNKCSLPLVKQGNKEIKPLLYWNLITTSWNKMVKRDFIEAHNLYFEEGYINEDEIWNFDIAQHIESLGVLKETTYIYTDNQKGIMNGATQDVKIANKIRYLSKIIDKMDSGPYSIDHQFLLDRIKWLQRRMLTNKNDFQNIEILYNNSQNLYKKIKDKNQGHKDVKLMCTLLENAAKFQKNNFYLVSRICFRLNHVISQHLLKF